MMSRRNGLNPMLPVQKLTNFKLFTATIFRSVVFLSEIHYFCRKNKGHKNNV